jgi:transcription initiation factor TFIIIB Brf1 subunit/transcription initiation factor TFIIB
MTSCPVCYCMVEEKFMSMHIMWHEENDSEQEDQYVAQPMPINHAQYDL